MVETLFKATGLTLAPILTSHNAVAGVGTDKLSRVFDCASEEALAALAGHRIEVVAGGAVVADDANLFQLKVKANRLMMSYLELVVIGAGKWQIVFVVAHLHFGIIRVWYHLKIEGIIEN